MTFALGGVPILVRLEAPVFREFSKYPVSLGQSLVAKTGSYVTCNCLTHVQSYIRKLSAPRLTILLRPQPSCLLGSERSLRLLLPPQRAKVRLTSEAESYVTYGRPPLHKSYIRLWHSPSDHAIQRPTPLLLPPHPLLRSLYRKPRSPPPAHCVTHSA
jgi:hypothetical protein